LKRHRKFKFSLPDETGTEISYIPSKRQIFFPGQIGGLYFRYQMEKYKSTETHKLRKGTKNYFRIVRQNGKIVRIDCFVDEKCDTILLLHYEGNKRFAFPYLENGEISQSYIQVQEYNDQNEVVNEILIRSRAVTYYTYWQTDAHIMQQRCIFYGPKTKDLEQNTIGGYYILDDHLSYIETLRPENLSYSSM
jgi:hypothetical protein